MNEILYEILKEVARHGRITYYADISPQFGLDMANQQDRNEIGALLGEISTYEKNQGRPLLSVVVIHRDNNVPGLGFFNLARELNVYNGADDVLFFIQELRRVHDYWQNH